MTDSPTTCARPGCGRTLIPTWHRYEEGTLCSNCRNQDLQAACRRDLTAQRAATLPRDFLVRVLVSTCASCEGTGRVGEGGKTDCPDCYWARQELARVSSGGGEKPTDPERT